MNLLRRISAYQHKVADVSTQVPLAGDMKKIIVYLKNFLEGAASLQNYRWYYEDFSSLYQYILMKRQIPTKIINDKYQRLLSFVNSVLSKGTISLQDLLQLGTLWDAWSISLVAVLKDDKARAVNDLLKRAIELMPK